MKRLLNLFLALVLSISPVFANGGGIKPPSGFDGKVYAGALALYASSEQRGIKDRFICTVQAVAKVKDGYELLGAGHCTSVNDELPSDMTFKVARDLDAPPLMPVKLVAAKMQEQLDYSVFYLETKEKLEVTKLGDESEMKIGDKTMDVNFSLALAKFVTHGDVASMVQLDGPMKGFFGVQQFDSHGASGSSVVSERKHKVIGIVIAGVDGTTTATWVEPISVIKKEIAGLDIVTAPVLVVPARQQSDIGYMHQPVVVTIWATARPVADMIRQLAAEEESYFVKNGQYALLEDLPRGNAALIRIEAEGYTWFYSVQFNGDGKIDGYKIQAWKARDCVTGGQLSYFIQQHDELRYRCATDGGVANEDDAKAE